MNHPPSHTIQAVLFDYGGVLAEEGFRHGLESMAKEQRLEEANMPAAAREALHDSGFVLGKGTEAAFWQLLRERTGLTGSDEALTQRILTGFVLRPWMIDLVRQLHERGYTTGILSDQTHWLDTLDERDHFYREFDIRYVSFYEGKWKRDPSWFVDVVNDLELPPEAILFVDDLPGNVARARESGMKAIQYVEREQFERELERVLSGAGC